MKPRIARLALLASLTAPLATWGQTPPIQAGWPVQDGVPRIGSQWRSQDGSPPVGVPRSPAVWSPGDAGYLHASHMIDARVHEILCEEPYSYGPCH